MSEGKCAVPVSEVECGTQIFASLGAGAPAAVGRAKFVEGAGVLDGCCPSLQRRDCIGEQIDSVKVLVGETERPLRDTDRAGGSPPAGELELFARQRDRLAPIAGRAQ